MSLQDGNVIGGSDFKSLLDSILETSDIIQREILAAGRTPDYTQQIVVLDTFNVATGDNNRVDTANTTALWTNKCYYSIVPDLYDDHEDSSVDTNKWTTSVVYDGAGNASVSETGGYINCYSYEYSVGNGTSSASATSKAMPDLSTLTYFCINSYSIANMNSANASAGAGTSIGGVGCSSAGVSSPPYEAHSDTSAQATYELIKINGVWKLYKDNVYQSVQTPTDSNFIISSSASPIGASPNSDATARSWYEYYSSYDIATLKTNLLITTVTNIQGIFVTPNAQIGNAGNIKFDISIDNGTSWCKKDMFTNQYINLTAFTGTQLMLKFYLNGNGTTDYVILRGYGVLVFL
jgi:hypothetical protein